MIDKYCQIENSYCVLTLFFHSEVFCDSNKNVLRENGMIRFPQLADTYEKIAKEGADVFYKGSMAKAIVKDIQAAGPSVFNS